MNREQKITLYLLAGVNFTHILDFMIMMPMSPMLIEQFGISPREFSFLASSYSIMAFVSSLFASFWVDRYDRKRVISWAYAGFIIGTFACALAPTYGLLMAARILAGFFGGILPAQVLSIVGDTVDYKNRAEAMSYTTAAFSLASVVGVPVGMWLATHFSWHFPFIVVAGIGLINMVLLYRFMPNMTRHLTLNHLQESRFALFQNIAADSNQLMALAVSMLIIFGHFSTIPTLSAYLVSNVGMRKEDLPLIYLVGGAATIFSARIVGRLADQYGKYRVFAIAGGLSLIPMFCMTNLPPIPLWGILTVSVLFFVFSNSRMITQQAIVSSVVHPERRGGFLSVNSSLQSLASGLGSLVAGFIVQETATKQLIHYNWVGYMAMFFLVMGVWLASRLKRVE